MTSTLFSGRISRKAMLPERMIGAILLLTVALGGAPAAHGLPRGEPGSDRTTAIPVAEFTRMVQEFSEAGGFFQAENFTSNENTYLHIVGKLQELGISGGAYLGVGPEQNFTYIAKIRPRIAFIVDIRRQAMIQHLLYKAIFRLAENRAQFLSWLFSKPLTRTRSETDGSLEQLLRYTFEAPTTPEAFLANLTTIRKTIEEDFQFPLSPQDAQSLRYVYSVFWRANLSIAYGYGFPSLGDLILETDLKGKQGNFLAREEDYQFVRRLQEQNRVIPVVGDFAGAKALPAVAGYLRQNGYTTSAFYTSNVEEYLYGEDAFARFVENVRKLPISGRSVLIRSLRTAWAPRHPAYVPGSERITLLQKVSLFLQDYQAGSYPDYWSLVTTHYISAAEPRRKVSPTPVSR